MVQLLVGRLTGQNGKQVLLWVLFALQIERTPVENKSEQCEDVTCDCNRFDRVPPKC
jgi:hypothetical protein